MMMFLWNPSFFSFLPFVFLTLFLYKWFFHASSRSQKTLPPSPPKLPVIGNLHQLGLLPHRSLQSLSKTYGPLMLLHLGSKPVVVASSADAAREIMKNHDLVFSNRPKSGIPDRLTYGSKDVAFSPYGEYWRQVRSVCVLQLLSSKRVQMYRHVREEETSLMIEQIRKNCSSTSSSSVVNLTELFVTLTNDVVSRVALGRKYSDSEDGRKIMKMIIGFGELLGVFDVGDFIPWLGWVNRFNGVDAKVKKVAKDIDEFMEHLIEEHRSGKKGVEANTDNNTMERSLDFVDILLEIQRKNPSNFALESNSLKTMIMDMFAAGTDTTHTVMEWAMVELLRHPKIMEKLQHEVRAVAQGKSEITEDDIDKMQYLKLVIKETLRLHYPVPLLVPREATRDIKVLGYDIPAGTRVIVNGWAIGRDPLLWEKPEEFQPERFMNNNIDFRGLNFELIPFGAGRRGCPGTTFAMSINEIALAKLLHKFDFALPDGEKPEDMDMNEAGGINVHRKLPVLVVATPYSPYGLSSSFEVNKWEHHSLVSRAWDKIDAAQRSLACPSL